MITHEEAMRDINVIAEKLTITQSLDLNKLISSIRNYINDMEWLEKEVEELKKRDIPMILTQASRFTTDEKLYGMYACNSCHKVMPYIKFNSRIIKPKFCYHCGQRIDWGEIK